MICPSCRRPLWDALVRNVYRPRAGEQRCRCRTCATSARLWLPDYLAETPYVLFGAMLIAVTLLGVLAADVPTLVRVHMFGSVLVLWAGLITLLTYTRARVRQD